MFNLEALEERTLLSGFQTDGVTPVVVSSSIADGSVLSPGPLTEVITFNEPIQPSSVSTSDISLYGEVRGIGYTPSSFGFDSTDTVLTINYANLPVDAYKFTLVSGPDNFTSMAGVPLQNDFIVNFTMPAGTTTIGSMQPVLPLGSRVYQTTIDNDLLNSTDVDTYDLSIDPQQTLAVVVSPVSASLTVTVGLISPTGHVIGSATSASPGAPVVLPGVQSSQGGTYEIKVSGGGPGEYTVTPTLNAVVDTAAYGGPSDSTIATALALDPFANKVAGNDTEVAALGDIGNDANPTYSFALDQGVSATIAIESLSGMHVSFSLYDDQGDLLASSSPGATNYTAGLNNFVSPADGTYFIQVSGAVGAQFNLVLTKGADFTTQPNSSLVTAQDITATELSGNNTLGGVVGYLGTEGADYYSVNTNAGNNLSFSTTTPAGGPNEFVNNLYPELLLYDPNGDLVAIANGNADDGRNSVIEFTVPFNDAGQWFIEVAASPSTPQPSQGEYGLLVTGATGSLSSYSVTSTTPAAGALVQPPSTITVTFNGPVFVPSLTAGELEVNGVAATAVTDVNGNTVTWTIDPSSYATGTDLPNVVTIGADAHGDQITDVTGQTLVPYSYTFFTNYVAPTLVVSSSIADGSVLSPGPLTEVITFNKPIQPSSVSTSDISLYGEIRGIGYTPSSFSFDSTDTILTIKYANLPVDAYQFALVAGPANFLSQSGVPLQNDFTINFTMPGGTSTISGLQPVLPLGSRVYQTTIDNDLLNSTDVDTYDLSIDPQQTLAVVVSPVSASLTVTVGLISPTGHVIGSATSASPGAPVVLPGVQSSQGGTYEIKVSGGGPGEYTVTPTLNAVVDTAAYGGPSDSTIATALALDPFANKVAGNDTEVAALGDIGNDANPTYSFALDQGVSATIAIESLSGMHVSFSLYDDQGDLLASSSPGATNYTAGLNNFVSPADGTYFIQVSGAVGAQFNLVLTKGADFTTQPNSSLVTAQDITATELSGNNTLGGVVGYLGTEGADYYSVNTNAGNNLSFSTTTPAGGPNEFVNNLYPELLLYDPNGDLVAIANGNADDGRNSVIEFTVPFNDAGQWFIEVAASPSTPQPSQGEYGLLVTGATGSLSSYSVTSTTPTPGALVQPPSTITVTFNGPVFVPSLTAGELEVNGVAATAVTDVNGNTVSWTIDPSSYATGIDLPNVVTIGADAHGDQITDVSGKTLIPFSYTFFTTNVAPTIVSSSIDGQVFSPAPANATEVVTFNQAMNTSFTTGSSFELHGNYRNVSYAAASWSWDPTGTILTINFSNLPDDDYTLTLFAAGFENSVGIPLTTDFTANFAVTLGTAAFGGTFTPVAPAGSLIYTGIDTHVLATSSDIDYLTVSLNAGETLTLIATPTTPSLQLELGVFDPSSNLVGNTTAPADGENAVLETVTAATTGTYEIAVADANGNTGLYSIQAYLNSYVKQGTSNDTIATAQDISGTSYLLGTSGADRLAVVGSLPSSSVNPPVQDTQDYYSFSLTEGESTTIAAKSQNGDNVGITLVDGSGDVLATGVGGATNVDASIENFVATYSGTYYVEITGDPGLAYSLVVTRGATFTIQPHNAISTAENLTGTDGVLGDLAPPIAPQNTPVDDWYSVNVQAGQSLVLQSSTPSDQGGQFPNTASLEIELFDTFGNLVAVGTKLPDGRNEALFFNAPISGAYHIEVSEDPGGAGEYYLSVNTAAYASGGASGEVFNDLNGSGSLAPGDPGLSGWEVDLYDSSDNFIASQLTDANGDFNFQGLAPGTYTVAEVVQSGWTQTAPPSYSFTISVTAGSTATGLDFGNFQNITVSGVVYNDLSGSGIPSPMDPNLANWTIDLEDTSGNVLASVVASSTGRFTFTGVAGGTYLVAEVVQTNWVETEPFYPTVYTINTQSGTNVSGLVFGNHASPALNPVAGIGNGQPGYAETGSWSTAQGGYLGTSRIAATTSGSVATATASWTFGGLAAGSYAVYVTYVGNSTYSAAAPFTVYDGGTSLGTVDIKESIRVTQSQGGLSQGSYGGAGWLKLGTYTINSGTLEVLLSNKASGQFVDANGILIVPQSTPGVILSSTGANNEVSTSLGTTPPITPTNESQTPPTTVNGTSPTVAISGVSAPGAVHVVYNQGATTSNTTTPSSVIDEALSQVDTAGKKKSSKRPHVHRPKDGRHAVIRSGSSHPTRRSLDKLSHRN